LRNLATLSSSPEHSPSEQIELRSAVHLPFEQLQPIDLALGLTVAPLQREPGFDHCSILHQAAGEPLQLGDFAGGHPRQPRVESLARSLPGLSAKSWASSWATAIVGS
jgi:hypothetical protein